MTRGLPRSKDQYLHCRLSRTSRFTTNFLAMATDFQRTPRDDMEIQDRVCILGVISLTQRRVFSELLKSVVLNWVVRKVEENQNGTPFPPFEQLLDFTLICCRRYVRLRLSGVADSKLNRSFVDPKVNAALLRFRPRRGHLDFREHPFVKVAK